MSTLGWVDFSSTDREQVSKILAMFREPGTLDELGIGQIRDAFADLAPLMHQKKNDMISSAKI